mmetsp:Transcript_8103/g.17709  ORF Transcript_8103/g.17709 Transcript_8103/m.17709 type:complete len:86 (+) Transcript_8103:469-726(+)
MTSHRAHRSFASERVAHDAMLRRRHKCTLDRLQNHGMTVEGGGDAVALLIEVATGAMQRAVAQALAAASKASCIAWFCFSGLGVP